MSLIDDALKRAQAAGEGERQKAAERPWIPTPMPDPGLARRRAVLRGLAIAAVLAILGGGGAWLVRREFEAARTVPAGEGRGEKRPVAALVPPATPTPDVVEVATPPGTPRPRPTRPPAPAAEGRSEASSAAPVAAPTAAPAPSRPLSAVVDGKSYAGSVTLPGGAKIELGGIVWSETEPRALVNDRIVAVGAYVEGFNLSRIEENRIALEKDGATIYLTLK